jgi:hypothetical protein
MQLQICASEGMLLFWSVDLILLLMTFASNGTALIGLLGLRVLYLLFMSSL